MARLRQRSMLRLGVVGNAAYRFTDANARLRCASGMACSSRSIMLQSVLTSLATRASPCSLRGGPARSRLTAAEAC